MKKIFLIIYCIGMFNLGTLVGTSAAFADIKPGYGCMPQLHSIGDNFCKSKVIITSAGCEKEICTEMKWTYYPYIIFYNLYGPGLLIGIIGIIVAWVYFKIKLIKKTQ